MATRSKAKASRPARRRPTARKEPETLRLRSVSPGLTVNDIHRSIAWYRDVLGCVVGDQWEHEGKLMGCEMKAGAATFVLGQDDWKKGRDRKKGEGMRIYCTTAQDVDKIAAHIKARGGLLTHDPRTQPWGSRDFGIIDPDGFKITISNG